jgi:hypothetical protein
MDEALCSLSPSLSTALLNNLERKLGNKLKRRI